MEAPNNPEIDKPPFFNSWHPVYALVIGVLVVQIIVFYALTRSFE